MPQDLSYEAFLKSQQPVSPSGPDLSYEAFLESSKPKPAFGDVSSGRSSSQPAGRVIVGKVTPVLGRNGRTVVPRSTMSDLATGKAGLAPAIQARLELARDPEGFESIRPEINKKAAPGLTAALVNTALANAIAPVSPRAAETATDRILEDYSQGEGADPGAHATAFGVAGAAGDVAGNVAAFGPYGGLGPGVAERATALFGKKAIPEAVTEGARAAVDAASRVNEVFPSRAAAIVNRLRGIGRTIAPAADRVATRAAETGLELGAKSAGSGAVGDVAFGAPDDRSMIDRTAERFGTGLAGGAAFGTVFGGLSEGLGLRAGQKIVQDRLGLRVVDEGPTFGEILASERTGRAPWANEVPTDGAPMPAPASQMPATARLVARTQERRVEAETAPTSPPGPKAPPPAAAPTTADLLDAYQQAQQRDLEIQRNNPERAAIEAENRRIIEEARAAGQDRELETGDRRAADATKPVPFGVVVKLIDEGKTLEQALEEFPGRIDESMWQRAASSIRPAGGPVTPSAKETARLQAERAAPPPAAPRAPVPRPDYLPEAEATTPEAKHVRQVAQALKRGEPEAVATAARDMATRIPDGAVLVPMPGATGKNTANLELAKAIIQAHGGNLEIADVLRRVTDLEPSHVRRRAGSTGWSAEAHAASMQSEGELPEGRPVVLIDNIETTGATAAGAREVLGAPTAKLETYAKAYLTPEEARPGNTIHRSIEELLAMADPNVPLEKMRAEERGYLDNLKKQILESGHIDKLELKRDASGKLMIDEGMHRLAAAQELGIPSLPTIVRPTVDDVAPDVPDMPDALEQYIEARRRYDAMVENGEPAHFRVLNEELVPLAKAAQLNGPVTLERAEALRNAEKLLDGVAMTRTADGAVSLSVAPGTKVSIGAIRRKLVERRLFAGPVTLEKDGHTSTLVPGLDDVAASKKKPAAAPDLSYDRYLEETGLSEAAEPEGPVDTSFDFSEPPVIEGRVRDKTNRKRIVEVEIKGGKINAKVHLGVKTFRSLELPIEDWPEAYKAQLAHVEQKYAELDGQDRSDLHKEELEQLAKVVRAVNKIIKQSTKAAAPAKELPPPEFYKTAPVVEGELKRGALAKSARTEGGDIRPLYRVADEGLFGELAESYNRMSDAAGRSIYHTVFDDDASVMVQVAGKRDAQGVSPQAKAFKNIKDLEALQDRIIAELKRRGHDDDSINDAMVKVWNDISAAEAKKKGLRAGEPGIQQSYGSRKAAHDAAQLVLDLSGKLATTAAPIDIAEYGKGRLSDMRIARQSGGAWVSILGQKLVRPEDFQRILAPFRSPAMEKFGVIITDDEGTILSHTLETSGAINYVSFQEDGRMVDEIVRRAERLGAKDVFFHHNHPSGDPTPSPDDINITGYLHNALAKRGIKMRGHYIIDHTKGTLLVHGKKPGTLTGHPVDMSAASSSPRKDWLDETANKLPITNPNQAAEHIRDWIHPGNTVVLFLDSQNKAVALEPHSVEAIQRVEKWLQQRLRAHGAASAIIAAPRGIASIVAQHAAKVDPASLRGLLDVLGESTTANGYVSLAERREFAPIRAPEAPLKSSRRLFEQPKPDSVYRLEGESFNDFMARRIKQRDERRARVIEAIQSAAAERRPIAFSRGTPEVDFVTVTPSTSQKGELQVTRFAPLENEKGEIYRYMPTGHDNYLSLEDAAHQVASAGYEPSKKVFELGQNYELSLEDRPLAPVGPAFTPGKRPPFLYFSGKDSPNVRQLAQRRGDVGLVVTPQNPSFVKHMTSYPAVMVDNGAFGQKGFEADKFERLLKKIKDTPGALERVEFVVAPDKPMDALGTLKLFDDWGPYLKSEGFPVALAAQNNMENMLERIPWDSFDVLFIGGDTQWKLGTVDDPGYKAPKHNMAFTRLLQAAEKHGKKIHVGRVNSAVRAELAWYGYGATSADGNFLGYGEDANIPHVERWLDSANMVREKGGKYRPDAGLPLHDPNYGRNRDKRRAERMELEAELEQERQDRAEPVDDEQLLREEGPDYEYRGRHEAPGPEDGAPLHEMNKLYPDDIYGPNAARYYGMDDAADREAVAIIQSLKGRPNARVRVYRALPDAVTQSEKIAKLEKMKAKHLRDGKVPESHYGLSKSRYYDQISEDLEKLRKEPPGEPRARGSINAGDWVTLTRSYAKEHGESNLGGRGSYRIVSKVVRAKELFTEANSLQEFGYYPAEYVDKAKPERRAELESAADRMYRERKLEEGEYPDDGYGLCSKGALEVSSQFGGKVYGYFSEDNPTAKAGFDDGGHDFALIDDRWIVDPWLKHVEGSVNQATLDLENPIERAKAGQLYGDRSKWELVQDDSSSKPGGKVSEETPHTYQVRELPPEYQADYEAVESGIDFTGDIARAARKGAPALSTRIQKFADALANQNGPIERLGRLADTRPGQNPNDLLTYTKTSDETYRRALNEGVIDPITREVVGPSFKSIFEPVYGDDKATKLALAYLVAKRNVGRGPSSVRNDKRLFAHMERLAGYGDNDPKLREVARRWASFVNAIGNYAVKSGLWTESLWEKMRDSDVLYVRFKRILEDRVNPPNRGAVGQKRYGNIGPGVDRFEGSKRAVSNPAEAMAEYAKQVIHRADRYRVGAAVFDAVDELGDVGGMIGTRLSTDSPEVKAFMIEQVKAAADLAPVEVMREVERLFDPKLSRLNPVLYRNDPLTGRKEFLQIHAPELWTAIMQLNAVEEGAVRQFLDVTIRPLKRLFTSTTTGWSPRFSLATNPARDIPDALTKTQAGLTPADIAKGYAAAVKDLVKGSDMVDEAARSGLTGVSIFAQDRPPAAARHAAPLKRSDRIKNRVELVAGAPVRALEAAGEVSDLGPRLGEYRAALRKFAGKVARGEWTPAEARLRAATLGRIVTLDFSNRPANPVLKLFADYVPFFGVGLQGPVRYGEAIARNPKRVAVGAALAAMAAVIAWVLKHQLLTDDERETKIDDRKATERSGYLFVPTPEGVVLKVPLGQEQGIIVNGVTAALDKVLADDPKALAFFLSTLARALPSGMDAVAQGVVPLPGIQQVQENIANRKVFQGRPVEPKRMQRDLPEDRRYDSTSPTFDVIAEGARGVGFGPMDSPLKAENVVRGVLSSATPLITGATDPLARGILGRKAEKQVPVSQLRNPINPLSALVASDPPSGTQSEDVYYDAKEKLEQVLSRRKDVLATKDKAAARELKQEYAPYLKPEVKALVNEVDKRLEALRDSTSEVRYQLKTGKISAGEAREKSDKIVRSKQALLRRAVRVLRRHGVSP